ncbi:nucleotidyltransferase domain-containing protein [Roseateles sp. GG27B]
MNLFVEKFREKYAIELIEIQSLLPNADSIFVYGSTVTGNATPNSDVDLIVLSKDISVISKFDHYSDTGVRLDIQSYDFKSCKRIIDSQKSLGLNVLAEILTQGILLNESMSAIELQRYSAAVLASGPPPFPVNEYRNALVGLLDDIEYCSNSHEQLVMLCKVHEFFAQAFLWSRGKWIYVGRHLVRALHKEDSVFAKTLESTITSSISTRDMGRLNGLAEQIFANWGGRKFVPLQRHSPVLPATC